MVFILYCNSYIIKNRSANSPMYVMYLFKAFDQNESSHQSDLFSPKRCSELPSNISTKYYRKSVEPRNQNIFTDFFVAHKKKQSSSDDPVNGCYKQSLGSGRIRVFWSDL